MLLKSEEYWNNVKNDLKQENSELVALHVLYTLRAYRYITGDITNLPVSPIKYEKVVYYCEYILTNALPIRYFNALDDGLHQVAQVFKSNGTREGIRKALSYLKEQPSVEHIVAISGLLTGILSTGLNDVDSILIMTIVKRLNSILKDESENE